MLRSACPARVVQLCKVASLARMRVRPVTVNPSREPTWSPACLSKLTLSDPGCHLACTTSSWLKLNRLALRRPSCSANCHCQHRLLLLLLSCCHLLPMLLLVVCAWPKRLFSQGNGRGEMARGGGRGQRKRAVAGTDRSCGPVAPGTRTGLFCSRSDILGRNRSCV